jgi:hypothetical protein
VYRTFPFSLIVVSGSNCSRELSKVPLARGGARVAAGL